MGGQVRSDQLPDLNQVSRGMQGMVPGAETWQDDEHPTRKVNPYFWAGYPQVQGLGP